MSAPSLNLLLLAVLKRAGHASSSDELLDMATGYATSADWPSDAIRAIKRRSVARRLLNMENAGKVYRAGEHQDPEHRQPTPTWAPTDGWDSDATLPEAPTEAWRQTKAENVSSNAASMLRHHEQLMAATARFLDQMVKANAALRAELISHDHKDRT